MPNPNKLIILLILIINEELNFLLNGFGSYFGFGSIFILFFKILNWCSKYPIARPRIGTETCPKN
jgi:hypothetical protein